MPISVTGTGEPRGSTSKTKPRAGWARTGDDRLTGSGKSRTLMSVYLSL